MNAKRAGVPPPDDGHQRDIWFPAHGRILRGVAPRNATSRHGKGSLQGLRGLGSGAPASDYRAHERWKRRMRRRRRTRGAVGAYKSALRGAGAPSVPRPGTTWLWIRASSPLNAEWGQRLVEEGRSKNWRISGSTAWCRRCAAPIFSSTARTTSAVQRSLEAARALFRLVGSRRQDPARLQERRGRCAALPDGQRSPRRPR